MTAEGEVYFNHQTNTAVKTEGAFLTVVASPTSMDKNREGSQERRRAAGNAGGENATANNQAGARTGEQGTQHHHGDHRRHNVYIVWLTPKTKVCTAQAGGVKSNDGSTKSEAEKKEMAFDQLEVGDHVEIAFTPFEDSDAHKHVHQSQHMQSKHGRHRTHIGYATAITILSTPEQGQNGSAGDKKSSDNSK